MKAGAANGVLDNPPKGVSLALTAGVSFAPKENPPKEEGIDTSVWLVVLSSAVDSFGVAKKAPRGSGSFAFSLLNAFVGLRSPEGALGAMAGAI